MEGMDAAKGIMASLAFGWIFGGLLAIFYGRTKAVIYNAVFFALVMLAAYVVYCLLMLALNLAAII